MCPTELLNASKLRDNYYFEELFMKYFFHSILVLVLTNACFAQQQYTFSNYTQEHGLPSGTIRGIHKEINGI